MAQHAKKIGVLTFHNCINYGSYWQARCLVEALRARGHDAELLDHDCRCVRRAEAKCALQPKLPERTPRRELRHYRLKTRKSDEQRIAEGPVEFAKLMSGARAVITNFFHGCVFALLHGKPWAAAPSDYRAIKIPDLATVTGTRHHLVDTQTTDRAFTELLDSPTREAVATRVAELRQRSEDYLDAALS
jgi:transposase